MLVFIEKIYQTLEIVFEYYSKHLEVRQKYSAARTFFLVFGNVAKQSLSWLIYYLSHTSLSKNSKNHNCEEGYTSNFVKIYHTTNFQLCLLGFGNPDETLSLVLDMLHKTLLTGAILSCES